MRYKIHVHNVGVEKYDVVCAFCTGILT